MFTNNLKRTVLSLIILITILSSFCYCNEIPTYKDECLDWLFNTYPQFNKMFYNNDSVIKYVNETLKKKFPDSFYPEFLIGEAYFNKSTLDFLAKDFDVSFPKLAKEHFEKAYKMCPEGICINKVDLNKHGMKRVDIYKTDYRKTIKEYLNQLDELNKKNKWY